MSETKRIEIDIGDALYKDILGVVDDLMFLDPEKDSPGGELLVKIAKAVSEYEDNYFKFGEK